MKSVIKVIFCFAFFFLVFPIIASAHQPRLVSQSPISVPDPEVSKAYYGRLAGAPHIYRLYSAQPFAFYAGLLLPDRPGQKRDVSAVIYEVGKEDSPVAALDGMNFAWGAYYEQFGADNYFKGPEFKAELPAGSYEIKVMSSNNDSRYSLAIGEIESFPLGEIINTLQAVPRLKREFFASSPFTFLKSPFGVIYVIIMIVLAFIFGLVYRLILRRLSKNNLRRRSHNIGRNDRLIRAALGLAVLVLGIYSWNPIILFLAGFLFFEAIFSWCGLYAALGKNSCPL